MKVIDLLNKIANGEIEENIEYKFSDYDYCTIKEFFNRYVVDKWNLNLEIIEEKKIPEKLYLYEETQNIIRENNYKLVYHDIHKCIVSLKCKYNEIIDYLKSKGE